MRLAAALPALAAAVPAAADGACDPTGRACFAGPVDRYGRRVLGETPEWSRLTLDGAEAALPAPRVFEDLAPRLIETTEGLAAVVVESDAEDGARLALYAVRGGALRMVAATPPIGTRFRWLAPVGVADFSGEGALEIAYVERPHLAGLLRVWRLTADGLVEVARPERGFSNHRIGEAVIASALRDCGGAVEMILPDFGWTGLRAARVEGGAIRWREVPGEPTPEGVAEAARC